MINESRSSARDTDAVSAPNGVHATGVQDSSEGNPVGAVTSTDLERLEQRLKNDFQNVLDKKQTKTTEVLAIFITLFTFISVQVNIFSKIDDLHNAAWFMILMTLCSIALVSFLFIVIDEDKISRGNWKAWVGLLASFAFMVFLLFGYEQWFPLFKTTQQVSTALTAPSQK